ncbi:MAG: hypothetical protein SGI74_14265 [Oligoflexia bacterium]|nr:hypothetical protein [Oligoflexia bacterium]
MNSVFFIVVIFSVFVNDMAFAKDSNKTINSRIKEVHTRVEQEQAWAQKQILPSHQGGLYLDTPTVQPMDLHNSAISNVNTLKMGEQSATIESYQNTPRFKASDPETEFLEDSARIQDGERRAAQIQRVRATEFERRLKAAGVKVDKNTTDQLKALGYMN